MERWSAGNPGGRPRWSAFYILATFVLSPPFSIHLHLTITSLELPFCGVSARSEPIGQILDRDIRKARLLRACGDLYVKHQERGC